MSSGSTLTAEFTSVYDNQQVRVRVQCKNDGGESEWSDYTSYIAISNRTAPNSPGSFTAPIGTLYVNTNYTAIWGASLTSGVTYRLGKSYDNGSSYPYEYTTANTSYTINAFTNNQVKLRVRAEKDGNYSSWVYSSNFSVIKYNQSAPSAPTLYSRTTTSITLNSVSGCEYMRSGGSWQDSIIFSGLSPNTSYTFYRRYKETSTHYASPASSGSTFTTLSDLPDPPPKPSVPSSISWIDQGVNTSDSQVVRFTATKSSTATHMRAELDCTGQINKISPWIDMSSGSTLTAEFTSVYDNQQVRVRVQCKNDGGESLWSDYTSYITISNRTAPSTPGSFTEPSGTIYQNTDFTVTWGAVSEISYYRLQKSHNNGVSWDYSYIIYTNSTIANAESNNQVKFRVMCYDAQGNYSTYRESINYTVEQSLRPNNWYWSYNIVSGGDVYNTIMSGNTIYAYIIPATEWNNFTNRINQFRTYKGLSNYSFTSVSSDNNFTHTIINQAVTAINAMGFSISSLSSGVDVPASVFIQMRDSLNSL
jgi:hypothetical protein